MRKFAYIFPSGAMSLHRFTEEQVKQHQENGQFIGSQLVELVPRSIRIVYTKEIV